MSRPVFHVHPASIEPLEEEQATLVSAAIECEDGVETLYAKIHEPDLAPPVPGDAFLAATLIAAMKTDRVLRLSDPVSPALLAAIPQIQPMLNSWYPELHVVPVEAKPLPADEADRKPAGKAPRVAHFFTGGVDSLYSLQQHLDETDALVFIQGTDIPEGDSETSRKVVTRLEAAARELGKPLVRTDTNIGRWSQQFGWHGNYFVGSRLAFIAHLLGGMFPEWIVAPSVWKMSEAFTSHPMLDPLWSSEQVTIRHQLTAATRAAKLKALVDWELPLRYLRVCPGAKTANNCGKCPKCVRTMVGLEIMGALDRCPAFPGFTDLEKELGTLQQTGKPRYELHFLREHIELGREIGADPKLLETLERTADRMDARLLWDKVAELGDAFFEGAKWDRMPFQQRREIFTQLLEKNPDWLPKAAKQNLDRYCDSLFDLLWRYDRKWLIRSVFRAWLGRFRGK